MVNLLNKFCLFIGYAYSGSTITGNIIDMHPNIKIAKQFDVLKFMRDSKGDTRKKIINKISNGKQYEMIGTKAGHKTLKHLFGYGEDLMRFKYYVGMKMYYIHIIRNPFDNISSWTNNVTKRDKRHGRILLPDEHLTNIRIIHYDKLNEMINNLKSDENIYSFYLENLISNPDEEIKKLFNYLEIDVSNKTIDKIIKVLYKKPTEPRLKYKFTENQTRQINNIIQRYEWLKGYKL